MAAVKKGETVLMAGTRKGLYLFHSKDRKSWKTRGPYFAGYDVRHAMLDPRDGKTVWAGVTSEHWGPTVHRSTDFGEKWVRGKDSPHFSKESGLSVTRVWSVTPGKGDEIWCGVEPAGLFRSDDGGDSWTSIDSLNYRPERKEWFPGGGGLMLHTILPHPKSAKRMIVGISVAGVYASDDGCKSWKILNGGVVAGFMPDQKGPMKDGQHGACAHKLTRDAKDPDLMFFQHHGGVLRRGKDDSSWQDIAKGLPSDFGFPIVTHPHDGGTVYAVPLTSDEMRVMHGGKTAVWRSVDAGKRWEKLTKGLPQKNAYLTVLRDAMRCDDADPAGVYVGTTTGQLFGSRNEGDSWTTIGEYLPPIMSVGAGSVS